MYLSKLEIIGFKSFANRTTLKFDEGMTAIVGPNGCGKSNVVDAIRWALGEQKASILRSDLMENVIFNGSRTRKALGMSEVSLTIENTKGVLPTEYSEVTITRRLFRSGESEYLLNKAQCRLKDIVELFMDTGMGANAYSVIELKMIETILSDRTEERRKLFEEAAGVTKYKARRKEALRRLDQVSQDLEQIDAIIKEVTKNVGSLERQAEKAAKYNDISAALRSLEIDVLEREYAVSFTKLSPLHVLLGQSEDTRNKVQSELARFEGLIELALKEDEEIEDQLRISQRTLRDKNETYSRLRETIVSTDERIRSLDMQYERTKKDIERIEAENMEQQSRLVTAEGAIGSLQNEAERLKELRTAAGTKYDEARAEVDTKRLAFGNEQRVLSELIVQKNDLASESAQLQARLEELDRRKERHSADDTRLQTQLKDLKVKEKESSIAHENALRTLADAEEKRRVAVQDRESIKDKIDSLQSESFRIQREIGQHTSKVDFLTSLVERQAGTSEGSEFLLKNSGWSRSGAPITVLDAVSTSAEYRVAIENALGESGQYFIAATRTEALEAIESLRHSQKGKATFIALDEVPVSAPPQSVSIGKLASELIQVQPAHDNLYNILLGNTVVVSSFDEALKAKSQHANIARFVTLDGEIITKDGVIRGGSKKNSEGSLIGKQQQIEELNMKVKLLYDELKKVETSIAELSASYEKILLVELDASLVQARDGFRIAERAMEQDAYEIKRMTEQLSLLDKDRDEIARVHTSQSVRLAEIAPAVTEIDDRYTSSTTLLAELQLVVQTAEGFLNDQSTLYTEAQVKHTEAASLYEQTRSEIARLKTEITNDNRLLTEKKSDCERFTHDKTEYSGKADELNKMLESLGSEIKAAESQNEEILSKRKEKQDLIGTYRESLRSQRSEHDKTIDTLHELQLKIQELEGKLSSLRERALTEFEMAELPLKEYAEDDAFSFGEARESIQQYKQQIRSLGNVNHAAYEEFTREKERHIYLTSQRKDLADAQTTLLQTIEEINTTATTKFTETFELVRKHFQEIFQTLFTEGDECELRLEEGKDPLEAQIEIIAKPRGKKPNTIESLSGGEKTMTAIALLFSIYLVKPSPFCILDEVDAPLDDANIDRFLQLIRRFTMDTQFIVVTHNKRTMAAADALYGVTQEEDGISKIVSVRLKRDQQMAQAA